MVLLMLQRTLRLCHTITVRTILAEGNRKTAELMKTTLWKDIGDYEAVRQNRVDVILTRLKEGKWASVEEELGDLEKLVTVIRSINQHYSIGE